MNYFAAQFTEQSLTMKRIPIIFFAALLSVIATASQAAEKPNVLLIVADDQGWADIGYHNPEIRTPNLDRLAREGVELDCHYVQPQCTPTRVALMTGRYPSRFGNHCTQASGDHSYPFETLTMAKMLGGIGYDTALIGKWHMGSKPEWGPNHHGFVYSYGCFDGAVGAFDHHYRKGADSWHRNGEFIEEQGHVTDLIAADTVRWLKKERGGKPFFLYLPFTTVHTPLVEEQRWLDANAHIADPDRRLFAAAATHMDWAVGEVLAALEATGQRDNTLIIFTSDNGGIHIAYKGGRYPAPDKSLRAGFSSNAPLRGGKGELFEGGIRVPAFVHWPAKLAPRKLATPLHAADWMPTLAALTGFQPEHDAQWDGQNVWPLLSGAQAGAAPRELYWVWGVDRWSEGLRRGDWKIIRNNRAAKNGAIAPWMLFNLAEDPQEKTDHATDMPGIVAELAARFESQKAGDKLP